jgi:hypothetical protein
MKHQFTFGNHIISSCTNLEKQYRAATKQAFMYVGALIFVWVFGFIFRVSQRTRNEYLLIPAQMLNPFHGFLNFFIYTWPRYVKSREENPGRSFWWLLEDSIITTSRTKRLRRRLSDSERRTSKKRASIIKRSPSKRNAESLNEFGLGNKAPSLYSRITASPLEIVDDDEHDEERITALQTLQGLDSRKEDSDVRTMSIDLTVNNIRINEDIEVTSH